jgi:hypothetical protein
LFIKRFVRKAGLIFWLMALISSADLGRARQQNVGARDDQLLESELAVARQAGSYVIMNLEGRSLILKSRGITLKTWSIEKEGYWGKPVPVGAYQLLKKSTWSPPKRANITPEKREDERKGSENTAGFELDTLELKDMPFHFSLLLENNIKISIWPKTPRLWPRLLIIGNSVLRFVYRPLKTLWMAAIRRPYSEINLVLPSETEAKSLFWSLLEGQKCIVYGRT